MGLKDKSLFCAFSSTMSIRLFLSLFFIASLSTAEVAVPDEPAKELAQEPTDNAKTVEVSAPEEVKDTPETVSLESKSKSDVSEPVEEEAEESEEPVKESDEVGDSQLSEEPTEDFNDNEVSDEPTSDDEAIVPEEDHYFWHCHRYTGGTCSWFSCDRWRHAYCHHGRCKCSWGKCAWHGRCLWRSEMDLPEENEVVA